MEHQQNPDLELIDIGVNLTDPVFTGKYHGKQAHQDDFQDVLTRAREAGVSAQIITGGSLSESREALEMAGKGDDLYSTIGCHPTRSSEFESYKKGGAEGYLSELSLLLDKHARSLSPKGKAVAVGECGLDYDRLHFAPADVQRRHFALQLDLSIKYKLPLFLHSRNCSSDFASILFPRLPELRTALQNQVPIPPMDEDPEDSSLSDKEAEEVIKDGEPISRFGVVHSFTGTLEEVLELLKMGLFIGINGCSLKTEENLKVVKAIPLSRMLLETDSPWCDIRSTHASHFHLKEFEKARPEMYSRYALPQVKKEKWAQGKLVKGRNEPISMGLVAMVVSQIKGCSFERVCRITSRNSRWLFGL